MNDSNIKGMWGSSLEYSIIRHDTWKGIELFEGGYRLIINVYCNVYHQDGLKNTQYPPMFSARTPLLMTQIKIKEWRRMD